MTSGKKGAMVQSEATAVPAWRNCDNKPFDQLAAHTPTIWLSGSVAMYGTEGQRPCSELIAVAHTGSVMLACGADWSSLWCGASYSMFDK